jgi:hypothetical protein
MQRLDGPPKSDLRDLQFGVILSVEQIDVRRFLLADSPVAPAPGARIRLQTQKEPNSRMLVCCFAQN